VLTCARDMIVMTFDAQKASNFGGVSVMLATPQEATEAQRQLVLSPRSLVYSISSMSLKRRKFSWDS
jgi:hypothetical protein